MRDKRARDKGVFEGYKYAYKVKDRAVNSYSIDENAGLVDKILKEGGRSAEGMLLENVGQKLLIERWYTLTKQECDIKEKISKERLWNSCKIPI